MRLNRKKAGGVLSLAVIAGFFLIFPWPYSLRFPARCLARSQWMLQRESDGSLHTIYTNNEDGLTEQYVAYKLSRGDVFQFRLSDALADGNLHIQSGDTIGHLLSTDLYDRLNQMKDQLRVAKAALEVGLSGEKQPFIDGARAHHELAARQAVFQRQVAQRQDSLFRRNLISSEEFEAAATSARLAEIEEAIARANLNAALTGAKPERLEMLKAQILAVEHEIHLPQQRLDRLIIRSPISGHIQRSFNADTIAVIYESRHVAVFPVDPDLLGMLRQDQTVDFIVRRPRIQMTGSIARIGNTVQILQNREVVIVVATLEDSARFTVTGITGVCSIPLPKRPLASQIFHRLKRVIH